MISCALEEITLTPNLFWNTAPLMKQFVVFHTKFIILERKDINVNMHMFVWLNSSPGVLAVLIKEQRTLRKRMCLDARFL